MIRDAAGDELVAARLAVDLVVLAWIQLDDGVVLDFEPPEVKKTRLRSPAQAPRPSPPARWRAGARNSNSYRRAARAICCAAASPSSSPIAVPDLRAEQAGEAVEVTSCRGCPTASSRRPLPTTGTSSRSKVPCARVKCIIRCRLARSCHCWCEAELSAPVRGHSGGPFALTVGPVCGGETEGQCYPHPLPGADRAA